MDTSKLESEWRGVAKMNREKHMAKKQIVQRYDRTVSIWEFDAKVVDVIALLQRKVGLYGSEVALEIEYGYEGECDVILTYEEEETDKELERRLAAGRKKREKTKVEKGKQEERDRKEFARLSKKYA